MHVPCYDTRLATFRVAEYEDLEDSVDFVGYFNFGGISGRGLTPFLAIRHQAHSEQIERLEEEP